ncbi:MAG: helix-turn-helix domain-containing protein [Deltaproteobacteria bacterium]|jgi:transposase|nr:helix-turn-helix domain-containing protein [Deltaproteobacteria bacterium]
MADDQREIRRKKRVIEYAEKNGNIKTACRRFGIARSTFYLWRDRYRESGDEGLCDGDNYGRFLAYKFPKERRVLGRSR